MRKLTGTSLLPAAEAIPRMLVPWSRTHCWANDGVFSDSPEEMHNNHIKWNPVASGLTSWTFFWQFIFTTWQYTVSVLDDHHCLSKSLNSPILSIYMNTRSILQICLIFVVVKLIVNVFATVLVAISRPVEPQPICAKPLLLVNKVPFEWVHDFSASDCDLKAAQKTHVYYVCPHSSIKTKAGLILVRTY